MAELFLSKNMVEAKKMINKASAEVQKTIEEVLEREVRAANVQLRTAAERELERWKAIDGKGFTPAYF